MSQPFHESIVTEIQEAENPHDLSKLVKLLLNTDTPKNHDAIQEALRKKQKEFMMHIPSAIETIVEAGCEWLEVMKKKS